MKLKNVLITVNDLERSIVFYRELFGLSVVFDHGGNVIMTEGLVLQDKKYGRISSKERLFRKTTPRSSILKNTISKPSQKGWKTGMSRFNMSTGS